MRLDHLTKVFMSETTKAQRLLQISRIPGINIQPILVIKWHDYIDSPEDVLRNIMSFADHCKLAVRSSTRGEDTLEYSNAGRYESILNVIPQHDSIKNAVECVYRSYGTNGDEEILIQPMLEDVKLSGVVFTKDIDTYADYYIVNYHIGKDTAAVTGGISNDVCTFIKYKKSPFNSENNIIETLLKQCSLIEEYLGDDALDIEFACTNDDIIYFFQVRPIACGNKRIGKPVDIGPALNRIYKKAKKLSSQHPFLYGHTTCFGVMPDWNPAEILGVRPRKLAISLYKELITDSIWAHQRKNYGYRDLTMHPLMISFCGIPYIDTRVTFNSFIPEQLNPRIADKLVCHYINKLSEYPKYHDKIEFEIVYSCYYFGLPAKLKELLKCGFNENEITRIEFALLDLTNRIIDPKNGLYIEDIEKIDVLEKKYEIILNSDISLVDKIYWLIEECKAYGTLPFAGVARAAFIAVQFLKSFIDTGIMSQIEYDSYMRSLNTVNKQLSTDLHRYYRGDIDKKEIIKKYGHIRPGTYDILSKRYDEAFDSYFSCDFVMSGDENNSSFEFSNEQKEQIQQALDENGLNISSNNLLDFIKKSIEGREQLKFVFTKAVSMILKLVEELGNRTDISTEDIAHIDISVIKQLYVDLYTGNLRDLFMANISANKKQYESAIQIKLPSIIVRPEDIYGFYLLDEEPNFITQKEIVGKVCTLNNGENDIKGKIVFIQSADPGYDYIFSKGISGLVTQFGGANSHMAIRCAELGIPAVIGVGETRYTEWSSWNTIDIDCQKKQVIRI